jgi:hypothetical protein
LCEHFLKKQSLRLLSKKVDIKEDPVFRQKVMGCLPEQFAGDCKKPPVMVKAKHPIKTFIKKWL